MRLKKIQLIGFRNYLELDLDLEESKTIILGKNAQGKSNLLEVIQILSHIKSRRAAKDAELVNFDLKEAVIRATITDKELEEKNISLLIRKSGRRTLKINDVSKKPKELLHNLYSVSFMVDDLEIVNGSPSKRREWLDSVICQLNKSYKDKLSLFEDILKQRNSYLKELTESGKYYYRELNQSQKDQLQVWDDLFIDRANQISRLRSEFIKDLAPLAKSYYQKVSGLDVNLEFNYLGQEISQTDLEETRAKDFARSYSNVGPHRDDVEILLKAIAANSYASQGERRTITLAIKLTELELLKEKHLENPILLLDDVLAELDEDRQDFLLDSVRDDFQVVITTTHIGEHLNKWLDNSQVIEIEDGKIKSNNKLEPAF